MIYASFKPIHQWHNRWVVPNYLLLGTMAGLLLLDFIVRFWGAPTGIPLVTLAVIVIAWWFKEGYWRFIDTGSAPSTIATATGLGRRGRVRMLEPPEYRGELSPQGDGLPDRTQAPRAPTASRADRGVPRCRSF